MAKRVKKDLVFCKDCEYNGRLKFCRFNCNGSVYTGYQKLKNFNDNRYKQDYNLKGNCEDYLKKFQLKDLFKKYLEWLLAKQ